MTSRRCFNPDVFPLPQLAPFLTAHARMVHGIAPQYSVTGGLRQVLFLATLDYTVAFLDRFVRGETRTARADPFADYDVTREEVDELFRAVAVGVSLFPARPAGFPSVADAFFNDVLAPFDYLRPEWSEKAIKQTRRHADYQKVFIDFARAR